MALRLRRGGFSILATVCSSWVFISRSQSGRSQWQPLGNRQHRFVENANVSCPNQISVDLIFFWFPIPHHIPPTWPPKTSPWTTPRSWYPGCAWSYTSSSRRIFFGSMSSHHQAFYGITLGWRSSLGSLMLGGALHGWVATGLSHRKGQCFGVHVLGSNY